MAKSRRKDTATTPAPASTQATARDLQPPAGGAQAATGGAESAQDRIARRAYELYQARGGRDGLAMEDWLNAERELSRGGKP